MQEAEQSYRRAVNLLDRSVEDRPESVHPRNDLAQTLWYLADLLKQLRRGQEALDVRRRVIHVYETLHGKFAEDPAHRGNLALSYLELASLLQWLGRQTEAAEPYRKALELEVDVPDVNNDLAWFLVMSTEPCLHDPPLAVRLAQKAVAARPDSYNYRNTLGVAYYRSGDDRAAIAELEKATSMAAGTAFDWFFLAMAHWRLGDRDLSRKFFNRSAEWMANRESNDDELRRIHAERKQCSPTPTSANRSDATTTHGLNCFRRASMLPFQFRFAVSPTN